MMETFGIYTSKHFISMASYIFTDKGINPRDVIHQQRLSVSQMTSDMFRLLCSQSGPFLIHALSSGW